MRLEFFTTAIITAALSISARAMTVREALGQIESGSRDNAIGRDGEVSRYQIMPHIWKKYSQTRAYKNESEAWSIAQIILTERASVFLHTTHREPDAFDLYVLWNAPGHYHAVQYQKGRVSPSIAHRARRFANLVNQSK